LKQLIPLNFQTLFRKIERHLQDYGVLHTLKRGILYLFRRFYENRIYRIYRIDLTQFIPKLIEHSEFNFYILESKNLYRNIIHQIEKMEEWLKDRVESKLKSGGICLVALDNKKVIGFNLVALNKIYIPLINLEKILKPCSAWGEQITVRKDYRGKGLATQLRYKIFAELQKRGIKKFYGGAFIPNIPSLKLTRKVGFEEFVDLHYSKLFNHKKWNYKRIR